MTEQERYLFDLQGFLVVPNALRSETVSLLNQLMDAKISESCVPNMKTHRFVGLLDWGYAYRELIDNPKVYDYLEELLGTNFRIDHDYADIIRSDKGPIGTTLYGGGTPFNPSMYYHFANGRMYNGLTVVAYNLQDVNPGDGGFGCVPGSHKSNYDFPDEWRQLENCHPIITHVVGPAGTAVIFTEALTHGTLPWTGSNERRTLFYKYSPHPVSWAASYYDETLFNDLSNKQKDILEPPNARYSNRQSRKQ